MLDTNVLSELMRIDCSPVVLDWAGRFASADLYTTAISKAEILSGISILPAGRRRTGLELAALSMFSEDFAGRLLAFDGEAAPHYADVMAIRRREGRPVGPCDVMIIAIARAHGAAVATRNIADFEGCGVALHDPWREG